MSTSVATRRMPAEWSVHDSVWIGFPSHPELWEDDLAPAQAEVIAFAKAVCAEGTGETVHLVAATGEAARTAVNAVGTSILVETHPFGDIWLRDTGPIIVRHGDRRQAIDFDFNGWGGKYDLEGDDEIGRTLGHAIGLSVHKERWVFEGGALDVDGAGLGVTTEQCLLNPNRNPGVDRTEVGHRLRHALGIERLLWLGDGLLNDHTDGHVDNLARFVAEGHLALPEATSDDDPNTAVYRDAADRARAFGVDVVTLPSPGLVRREGEIIPASYMNFYIGNATVVVPQYGAPNDAAAVAAIGALFPGRQAVGHRADHILTGGGSFHCISQQVPAV